MSCCQYCDALDVLCKQMPYDERAVGFYYNISEYTFPELVLSEYRKACYARGQNSLLTMLTPVQ